MKIALSRMHFPVTTLGPGKRIGIWFQGCSIHCAGCVSKDTWIPDINMIDITEVEKVLLEWIPYAEGFTISGGEPFDQFEQLAYILRFIKMHSSHSTLVYTGYHHQDIQIQLSSVSPLIDALISEPFDFTQPQTKALLGSDNQILHRLTSLGESIFPPLFEFTPPQRHLDAMLVDDGASLVGVGEQELMHILSNELAANGYDISHTQTRLPEKE